MLHRSDKIEVVWNEFKAMRKKKKKPLTEAAEKRQWNRVLILSKNGLTENNIIDHLHTVCDSLWDNIYSNEDHLNNIIASYTKSHNIENQNGTKQNSNTSKGSNYYTYHKGSAYEQTATGLLNATKGYDFITKVRS